MLDIHVVEQSSKTKNKRIRTGKENCTPYRTHSLITVHPEKGINTWIPFVNLNIP